MMDTHKLKESFEDVFQTSPTNVYFAPGRINLIGEHIDYNGGFVFPCAISQGTYALVSAREDQDIHFYSMNFEDKGIVVQNLNIIEYKKEDAWTNYPKGVVKYIQEHYNIEHGLNILYYGNIPNGAGLSSSASLTVVTARLLAEIFALPITKHDIVFLTQRVENEFMGVNTGIMDQYAITFGKKDKALLLDTHLAKHDYVPVVLDDMSIIIMNTNKVRGLTDSKYNQRREECERALEIVRKTYDVENLCALNPDQFATIDFGTDEIAMKRARHAVSENQRVIQAVEVLKKGDITAFGNLLKASHESLRHDYEVTGVELDTLVDAANSFSGCVGARVTGAGFGGCAIALVNDDVIDAFIEKVGASYRDEIGYEASFYKAHIGDGAHEII